MQTPDTPSRSAKCRPLLLALAILYAAATITYSAAWMYYSGPSDAPVEIGMDANQAHDGLLVNTVSPGAPAEKAGLRVGDTILAINGRSVSAAEDGMDTLWTMWFQSHPGETVHLMLRRPGQAAPFAIAPVFRQPAGAGDSAARRRAGRVLLLYPAVFLIVALAVLFLRLYDVNAWLLALLFAAFIAQAPAAFAFRVAPHPLRDFLYLFETLWSALLTPLFYFFFAVFPTRSVIDRKLPWLKWALPVISACLRWGNLGPGRAEALPFMSHLFEPHMLGLMRIVSAYGAVLLGLAALLLNMIGARDVQEHRKLKVMLWGTLVGVGPAILIGLAYDLRNVEIPFWMIFTEAVFLFVLPLSFAYAVVKHRVMDIPLLLRRSARYFLVERGFAILILLVSIAITLWFGEAFARRFTAGPKAAIPIGATVGVLLFSGATQVQRHVRTRLDRAFFRSAYDAQQILETLAATALGVTDRQSLAALLHRQIHEALHPMPLVIYLRSQDGVLRAYAGHPPEMEMQLAGTEPVVRRAAEAGEAIEIDPASARGTDLEPLHPECLVSIGSTSDEALQGLMVLGPRLSEETYSTRDKRLLASVAGQAGIAMRSLSLAERMAERMESERRAEQEMQIARQVQSRLLPQEAPQLATLDCAGECIQTRAVGGDYYDFLDFGSGKLGLVLADISGKGISSALLMANLQASLRGQYALAEDDMPRLLRSVNHLFFKNTETNNYATMFFAIYDEQERTLRYVNCGHNPPLLLRTAGGVERLEATATVLGLFEQWDCTVAEQSLASDDILVIYTDGISEAAATEDGEEFGEERLMASVRAQRAAPSASILQSIIADVQHFSQGEQADDMTLIVAKCR